MKNYNRYYFIFFTALVMFAGCKKDSGSDNDNNNNQNVTPPTTNGQAIIYLKQDCNVGNVTVTINGVNRVIRDFVADPNTPDCGSDSSFAVYSLTPGTYQVSAAGGNEKWTGSVKVTSGVCSTLKLTCDGIVPALMGSSGTPRFNLQHSQGIDFDLHVITPDGSEINSYNLTGQTGTEDVESSCIGSDSNPSFGLSATNENVWFPAGYAPHGTYKFWVQFSTNCTTSLSGTYTVRAMDGLTTLAVYTGTITDTDPNAPVGNFKSPVYTLVY